MTSFNSNNAATIIKGIKGIKIAMLSSVVLLHEEDTNDTTISIIIIIITS